MWLYCIRRLWNYWTYCLLVQHNFHFCGNQKICDNILLSIIHGISRQTVSCSTYCLLCLFFVIRVLSRRVYLIFKILYERIIWGKKTTAINYFGHLCVRLFSICIITTILIAIITKKKETENDYARSWTESRLGIKFAIFLCTVSTRARLPSLFFCRHRHFGILNWMLVEKSEL